MKINQEHIRLLLNEIAYFSGVGGIDRSSTKKSLLDDAKRARKDCSPTEFEAKGANLYPKKGLTFEELCRFAIENEWVKEKGSSLHLTKKGEQKYDCILTDEFSPSYLAYKKQVLLSFDEKKMVRPDARHIMEWFAKGYPPERLMEWATEPNQVGLQAKIHHLQVLEALGYPEEKLEGHLVFQLVPELFLPYGEFGEVTLEIRGIQKPLNFALTKPYPNQRYVVGGLSIGRDITHTGIYPLILPKDEFPDSLDIELIWCIDGEEGYTITHQLHIDFEKERMTGNFYTSHQQLVRSSEVPSLSLTTFFPEDREYLRNREAHFHGTMTWNPVLVETVKLMPVPMELTRIRSTAKSTSR